MNRISLYVITLNEEKNLARALKSAEGIADELIVVDSGSTDKTEEIARTYGVRFFCRAWTNFSDQRNFAIAQATCEWIFMLDADEELSPELRRSLLDWKHSKPEAAVNVYEIARRTWYLGAWINHSGWYPNRQKRLFKNGAARYSGIVHESLLFEGTLGRLTGDLLHYTVDNFAEHEQNVERYSSLAAQKLFDEGKRNWLGALWFATPWNFLQSFVFRAGFLDGYRGALIAQMNARTTRLKFAKLGRLVEAERAAQDRK